MNMELKDSRGMEFRPFEPPVRVVSLVPSITELILDLGLTEHEVVGRTQYCAHPAGRVEKISVVGGTRDFEVEAVLALKPDLVIASREENSKDRVEELEGGKGGRRVRIFVTDPTSFKDALQMIEDLGKLVGRAREAISLTDRIRELKSTLNPPTRASAIYLIWMEPFMTVAPSTFISDMLRLAGYVNAIWPSWLQERKFRSEEAARYPEITLEEIIALRPGSILLASEPFGFREEYVEQLRDQIADLDSSFAGKVSIRLVNGEYFSWYGSRMELALEEFQRGLMETP